MMKEGEAKQSLPDRLDAQEQFVAARLDALRALSKALKPLYGALSDTSKAARRRVDPKLDGHDVTVRYYFSKTLHAGFDEAVERTTEALKQEGFGIITEMDARAVAQDLRPLLR